MAPIVPRFLWSSSAAARALLLAAAALFLARQADGQKLRGKVRDGVYSSPSGTFSVPLPQSLGVRASHREAEPGAWTLEVRDDLCRSFAVLEQPGARDSASFADWVLQSLRPSIRAMADSVLEESNFRIGDRDAVLVRYRQHEAAPCRVMTFENGKRRNERPAAEVAVIALRGESAVYRVVYMAGEGDAEFMGYRRVPVDSIARAFAGTLQSPAARP